MKIWEWIEENIDSHCVYSVKGIKKKLKEKTGYELKEKGIVAERVNQTVGCFKGLLNPLPNPKEWVISGYKLTHALLSELGLKPSHLYHGRGSQFRSDLDDIKKAER